MVARKNGRQEGDLPERTHPAKARKMDHTTFEEMAMILSSDSEDKAPVTIIFAAILIPGDGEPQTDAAVVIRDTRIKWVGSQHKLPAEYQDLKHIEVPVLMPGLWDCHLHFFGMLGFPASSMVDAHFVDPIQAGARCARSAYDVLMSGYTSVRCVGGYGAELSRVIDEGVLPGPNIYGAGAAISQTAGHGDIFQLPLTTAWNHSAIQTGNSPICVLADGIDECRKAVRAQIRRGAKVIKVLASGGVLSRDDDPVYQQFSDEELAVIVEEAKRMGRVVAAHVHGKAGMLAAIRAGCKTLEHGSYLDEEVAAKMKEAGTIYVPTRSVVEVMLQRRESLPPKERAKMEKISGIAANAYRTAIKSGLTIAFGTDSAGSPGFPLAPGQSALELKYGVKFGMTPLQAIQCSTVNAVLTVGEQAAHTGKIQAGYDADIIAVQKNPLDDIEVLLDTNNISHVWKGGKLWKKDGIGSFLGYDPSQ